MQLGLAAAGISGFRKMLNYAEKASPLRRTVTIEKVGNTDFGPTKSTGS